MKRLTMFLLISLTVFGTAAAQRWPVFRDMTVLSLLSGDTPEDSTVALDPASYMWTLSSGGGTTTFTVYHSQGNDVIKLVDGQTYSTLHGPDADSIKVDRPNTTTDAQVLAVHR